MQALKLQAASAYLGRLDYANFDHGERARFAVQAAAVLALCCSNAKDVIQGLPGTLHTRTSSRSNSSGLTKTAS